MKTNKVVIAGMAVGLFLNAAVAWAAGGEMTVTGVISKVDPVTRIATVTPANGAPIVMLFSWDVGGPCDICLGSGGGRDLEGQMFEFGSSMFSKAVTEGSTWTLTYTASVPTGAATWFPGGTVNLVFKAVAVKAK